MRIAMPDKTFVDLLHRCVTAEKKVLISLGLDASDTYCGPWTMRLPDNEIDGAYTPSILG
jgi:hypothetical protein